MLPFVDALVAPYCLELVGDGAPAPAEKLRPLIDVREAVSRASQDIRLSFCATSSQEAKRITDGVTNLLLAKGSKLDEAIWSTMEETSARLVASTDMEDDEDITWLSTRWATVHQIAEQAVQCRGYMPKIDNVSPLTSLIMETVACLEKMLSQKSARSSFPDQSLGFLFLINNSYFIWQQLYPITSVLESHMLALARKIDNYIETYLQLSWAPAEFHKTYTAQKLWKVPDPKLRRRLRVAVIEKVIPSFTKYLEYNNISPSRITPHDLMDMLQELFEG
ncbi:hypothetical protein HU200_060920 [Digitaria exilis]|uniref:Exocyst subunit Exo70 family protein n=1 Tax=Digitaria exilis TaxID=1010633 RepID=A0A835A9D1_9POAL|nr:hypothetical protein HU200_060920 [Digitaria exilis]